MKQEFTPYEKAWSKISDFMTQDVQCLKDKMGEGIGLADHEGYTLLGEYEVPRQCLIAIGLKHLSQYAGGIFHIELHDSSNNDIEGNVKIVFTNASKLTRKTIITRHTASMYKSDPLDRSHQQLVILGVQTPLTWAKERSLVQLYFKPDIDGETIDYDNTNNVLYIEYTLAELVYTKTPEAL
jgi:hypothetical protein